MFISKLNGLTENMDKRYSGKVLELLDEAAECAGVGDEWLLDVLDKHRVS